MEGRIPVQAPLGKTVLRTASGGVEAGDGASVTRAEGLLGALKYPLPQNLELE